MFERRMSPEEFSRFVLDHVAEKPEFPLSRYDEDSDSFEFISSGADYYAERLDSVVTLYRSEETGEIVGVFLEGLGKMVRQVVQKAPGFLAEIESAKVPLTSLIAVAIWVSIIQPALAGKYKKVRELLEKHGIRVLVDKDKLQP